MSDFTENPYRMKVRVFCFQPVRVVFVQRGAIFYCVGLFF